MMKNLHDLHVLGVMIKRRTLKRDDYEENLDQFDKAAPTH